MRLLDSILPQAAKEYSQSTFDQLIKKLQQVLNTKVHTEDDACENEAINYFLR